MTKRRRAGSKVLPNGRSTGRARFVQLEDWLYDSAAWNATSPTARALYLVFKAAYNGHNNGSIHLSRDGMMRGLGVGSSHTVAKARDELIAHGFVKVVAAGGFTFKAGAREGRPAAYELTEYPVDGREASKEFMSWRPTKDSREKSTGAESAPSGCRKCTNMCRKCTRRGRF